jgi:ATP-dependent exoDNAse (exonuclease V) alpha subunit
MQVILVGDLFQLTPVNRQSATLDFAHHSNSWRELNLKICYLTEQHRQELDDGLLDLLEAMRCNKVNGIHMELLKGRMRLNPDAESITRLYSHNVDVDAINQQHLDALPGKVKKFKMRKSGQPNLVATLVRNILAPEILELKVGAEVMFVANNFNEGFVNGSRGKVVKFKDGDPIVKMTGGRTLRVEMHSWKTKVDEQVLAEVEQLPLRLAWAITIHKSQGMSLDAAEIDLGKAFTPGMGYVALSRVRSLTGLYLQDINEVAMIMHEEIYALDELLREKSETLMLKRG